ncbi:sensor histidine kinase [Caenimonas koreensis]|uniref:sensor histidine kinase n=1 Tax=Caenimonas koreensis TaxID=367474 RepID=UPI00188F5C14|nr:HAMP domain-containing sensor histidine kinase [Caenimonas koreensis]
MTLSQFITAHTEQILQDWDEFAASCAHDGKELNQRELRDHAGEILKSITRDIEQPQSPEQQEQKSKGKGPRSATLSAAEVHADFRIRSGFAIDTMITEYRALRANILRMWSASGAAKEPVGEMTRFNESIDQAIAESVSRYTLQTKKSTDLFIGILGHDIRNPLGTIVMSAEILARTSQAPQKVVTTIINSAVRINGLIEQVLDFTRAQADGAMPIHRLPGNLGDQLAKVLHETQVRHPQRQLELQRSGTFDGNWDEGRVGQLLSNLLGNALRYGDPVGAVTLALWSDETDAYFSVHNWGGPIREQDLGRIFEPMARGPGVEGAEQRREPAGLGLGLYICREIVRAHGGALTVTSKAEEGTTFTVRLPRVAPAVR